MPTVEELLRSRGLTAFDRSESDKKALKTYTGQDSTGTSTMPEKQQDELIKDTVKKATRGIKMPSNYKVVAESTKTSKVPVPKIDLHKELAEIEAYKKASEVYMEKYGVNRNSINSNTSDYIKKIANEVSSNYKKYKDTDKLPLTNADYKKLAAEYDAIKKLHGKERAGKALDGRFKDIVGNNQTWYEQAFNAFASIPSQIEGGAVQIAGNIIGTVQGIMEDGEDSNLGIIDRIVARALNNPVTRLGRDISQSGASYVLQTPFALFGGESASERMKNTKQTATKYNPDGLGHFNIATTSDQEESFISSVTPWQAVQSSGYTALSMMTGAGEAKIASYLFNGLNKAASWLNKSQRLIKTADALTKVQESLKKVNNFHDMYIAPGIVGATEGAVNGLDTTIKTQQQGQRLLDESYGKIVEEEADRIYNDSKLNPYVEKRTEQGKVIQKKLSREQAYKMAWDTYKDEYFQIQQQIDWASAKAGIHDFWVNSLINGMLNQTLKAGLMAPKVQETIRNSRILGWAYRRPHFSIDEVTNTATARNSKAGALMQMLKEPFGEGLEEYLQSVSSSTFSGAAENNITSFIDNKLNGDGTAKVGDSFSSDWSAAWSSFTGSLTDTESIQSAILGAVGSMIGTVSTPGRGYHRDEKGNLVRNRNYFGLENLRRGYNERGEVESISEYLRRITPWRSGLINAYYDNKREQRENREAAATITRWLQDPQNRVKWDGLVGTANWMTQMQKAMEGNDQFAFRNSLQGKMINDVMVLSKLKGTPFYESTMRTLQVASTLDATSDSAQEMIKTMRENGGEEFSGKSDEEIVQKLKDNATAMLGTMSQIEEESKNLDRLMGRVDDDTKESLIFDKIMQRNFTERHDKLEQEIETLRGKIKTSKRSNFSDLTEEQKNLVLEYGSLENALKKRQAIEEKKKEVEERRAALEKINKKSRTKEQKEELDEIKDVLKQADVKLKKFDALYERNEKGKIVKDKDGKPVLMTAKDVLFTEEDIMNLDPITRAYVLQRGSAKFYNATHQNKQKIETLSLQAEDLQHKIEDLEEKKKQWLNSEGGIKRHHNKQVQRTDKQIAKLQEQKRQKERQIEAEKNRTKTERIYSEEQQAVIDNLVNQGVQEDADFLDKVIDMGRLEGALKMHQQQYLEMLTNPEAFQNYVMQAKARAKRDLLRRRTERVAKIEDYKTFAQELDNLLAGASQEEQMYIRSVLEATEIKREREEAQAKAEEGTTSEEREEEGQNKEEQSNEEPSTESETETETKTETETETETETKTETETETETEEAVPAKESNFQRYKRNAMEIQRLSMQFLRKPDLTNNDKSLLIDAMQYLQSKGVSLTDRDAAVEALAAPDESGLRGGEFRKYVESKNLERDASTTTTFTTVGKIVSDYVSVITGDSEDMTHKNEIHPTVESESQTVTTPPPSPSPSPTETETTTPANPKEETEERKDAGSPGIFGVIGHNSPDDMQFTDSDGTVATGTQTPQSQDTEEQKKEKPDFPIMSAFKEMSAGEILKYIETIESIINNSSSEEGKAEARRALLEIARICIERGETINTVDNLKEILSEGINTLKLQANQQEQEDNPYSKGAGLLSKAFGKIQNQSARKHNRSMGAPINKKSSMVQSMNIEGMRKATQGKTRPWAVSFYDAYDIDNFHRTHEIGFNEPVYFITNSEWEEEVASQMGDQYNALYDMPVVAVIEMREPTEEDKRTCIEINGLYYQPIAVMSSTQANVSGSAWTGELRKNASKEQGLHFITEKGLPNGKPITTTVFGKNYRVGYHKDSTAQSKRDNSRQNDTNLIDDILNNLPDAERARLQAMPKQKMLEDPVYKKARKQRLDIMFWDSDPQSKTANHVVIRPNRMRGNNEKASGMIVMPVSMEESKDKQTGKSLLEVIKDEPLEALRSFNSRTERLFDEVIRPMFQYLPRQDHKGDRSALCITRQTLEESGKTAVSLAQEEAARLTKWLNGYDKSDKENTRGLAGVSSFVYMDPSKWRFEVTYIPEDPKNVVGENVTDSVTAYSVQLIGTDKIIVLPTIYAGKNDIQGALLMMRDLLYDSATGSLREGIRWQIPASDTNLLHEEGPAGDHARRNYAAMIDDGLLNFAGSSSQYNISGILFRSPTGMRLSNDTAEVVSNKDNAEQGPAINNVPQAEGAIITEKGTQIEPNSGVQTDNDKPAKPKQDLGVPKPQQSEKYKKAKAVAERIQEDSKEFALSEDESCYVTTDKRTGETTRYARVTSIIKADESAKPYNPTIVEILQHLGIAESAITEEMTHAGNIQELSQATGMSISKIRRAIAEARSAHAKTAYGAWATPSTAIGTTVDSIVRDFFNGETSETSSYPNTTREAVSKFQEQLQRFKESLEAEGIHIVPNGVVAHGNITTTDTDGKKHDVKVAGTLDLFGYDDNGNFYIFDMKTVRNHGKEKLEAERGKWSRQISLYADLLSQQYGIDIDRKNLRIIPIDVEYEAPQGNRTKGMNPAGGVYSEGQDHQLTLTYRDGSTKTVQNSNPKMQQTDAAQYPVGYTSLKINWDNLTSTEQDIAEGLQAELQQAEPEAKPVEAEVEKPEEPSATTSQDRQNPPADNNLQNSPTAPPIVPNGTEPLMPLWKDLSKEAQSFLGSVLGISDEASYNEMLSNEIMAEAVKQGMKCGGFI